MQINLQDYEKAKSYFTMASKQNNPEAMFNMGRIYYDEKKYAESEKWFKDAAELGHKGAILRLAHIYSGKLVEKYDYDRVAGWLKTIAENGEKIAWVPLKECYQNMAQTGDEYAMYELGKLFYFHRDGITQNYKIAKEWFEKAANKKVPEAMIYLGFMYKNGRGVPMNIECSNEWFIKVVNLKTENNFSKLNDAELMTELGDMYKNGKIFESDDHKAVELYIAAAKLGYAKAIDTLYILSLEYAKHSQDSPQNKDAFIALLMDAAKLGNKNALNKLRYLSANGLKSSINND